MTVDRHIRTRPGAPLRRDPAVFHTPDRAGTYAHIGTTPGAACGNCRVVDRRKGPMGRREYRCGIAVMAAAEAGRRLPETVGAGRPACSRYKPAKGKRGPR